MKCLADFDSKDSDRDVDWLLKQLQKETAGIDSLGNKHVNHIKALRQVVNLKQGSEEDNDSYLKRFCTSVDALKLAGGGHVLTSPDLISKAGTVATDE